MRSGIGRISRRVIACVLAAGTLAWWGPWATAQSDPAVVGQWTAPMNWPEEAVHAHMLPTGRVLLYPHSDEPYLWDPATGTITPAPPAGYNIFCNGHAFLADGRLLMTGGHRRNGWGLSRASLYDPFTNTWTHLPDMNGNRWYPTNTALGSGEMLVISGSINTRYVNNDLPQVWQPALGAWRDLTSARRVLPLYPFMFAAPDGRVFNAGPNVNTAYLDTAGTGAWTAVGNTSSGIYRDYGTAVMYGEGKVLLVGGGDPPSASAEIIELTDTTPAWRPTSPMYGPRRQHNATLLPDGTVLITGGSSASGFDNASGAVHHAELWNPVGESWSMLASAAVYRGYHSTALLLPDGRVLSAGGDNMNDAEVFSPPYLFKGPRPVITAAPAAVRYGYPFFVQTPDATNISRVTWIRLSSVTHAFNQNQRINELQFTSGAGELTVTPPSANLAPPGHYLLFILNGSGVPSVAAIVRIDTFTAPPAAPTGLTATAGDGHVSLAWARSTEAGSYKVKRATTSGGPYETIASNVALTTYVDTGVTNGTTYNYVVSAVNPAGESLNSGQATATPAAASAVPAAPSDLTPSVVSNSQINLTWLDNSTGEDGFKVERSLEYATGYEVIATVGPNVTSYADTGLAASTKYYHRVRAFNGAGDSAYSNIVGTRTRRR